MKIVGDMHHQKKLKDYRQTQLILPGFFPGPAENYSSTIELYDAIPKYIYQKRFKRIEGRFLDPIQRNFVFRNESFCAKIIPARVEVKKGEFKDFFPGLREELIEDALRKLIADGQSGVYLDDKVGAVFTLYQLQKELESMGHKYDIGQLKQGLFVCAGTRIKIESLSGNEVLEGSLFENIGLQTMEEWKGKGKKSRCFIRFNILVDKSIKQCTFRPLNYAISMGYKNSLARWLHKRMNHLYTQASWQNPYTITLSTIIRDSGRKRYAELRNNLREARKALEEMQKKGILREVIETPVREGRKLKDIKFKLIPGGLFIKEMKVINAKIKEASK